ncbi:hypothetical protein Tco_0894527 [Tanacetum coccineum]|uniref:Uncharacterized protein n=1 Tax=Tanacetum coccineum TaxID=301880 RepID=A0ABQ5CCE0_9ASTR
MKTSNYDPTVKLTLKATRAHAYENRNSLERYNQHVIDPLAFVANVSSQQYPTQSAISQTATVYKLSSNHNLADHDTT